MPLLLLAVCLLALSNAPADPSVRQDAMVLGVDMRPVDGATRTLVIDLLEYRVRTKHIVEPLLIFSPLSDPDILGIIAVDRSLSLPVRELAANAVLDQLYLSSAYFQAGSEHYLRVLTESSERSLRLKGWIGLAIIEYWYFFTDRPGMAEPKRLYTLQYAASIENDPGLRQALDQLSLGEPSDILGSAAFIAASAAAKPYRQFDTIPNPAIPEGDSPGPPAAKAWEQYRDTLALTQRFANERLSDANLAKTAMQHMDELRAASPPVLQGYLARYNAFTPSHELTAPYPTAYIEFFKDFVKRTADPWMRSLAIALITHAPRADAIALFIWLMNKDDSALVRLTAVDLLRHYCDDSAVREAITTAYRMEDDVRVRKRMLHSLMWPFAERPAPDVVAFMSRLLQQERSEELLEFVVSTLSHARARNAASQFSKLLTTSRSVTLRARLADALAALGLGNRLRALERPQS